MDGGILFSSCLLSKEDRSEEEEPDNGTAIVALTARRITKGQTVPKIFSEKQIVLAFVKGLEEERGRSILTEGTNAVVDSVFHLWM